MNFSQALEAMKKGQKIKRKHWGGYWFISNNSISYHIPEGAKLNTLILASLKNEGGYVPASPYQEDLLADDWEII
ncbi:Thoeris anti-defense Tad2 family protein [Bacillus infantis]|uniref:Thoeris anti-defense Tad2 family protein n=1 Tax=Bacillus infantis TaxID=324767 RepID=UPI003CF3E801